MQLGVRDVHFFSCSVKEKKFPEHSYPVVSPVIPPEGNRITLLAGAISGSAFSVGVDNQS